MKLDAETRTLQFATAEELEAFHRELTTLLREVTTSVNASTADPSQARDRARDVLREFSVVARILNAIRKSARREPGT